MKIIIYGAGVFGRRLYFMLRNTGLMISCFAKSVTSDQESCLGIPVISIDEIPSFMDDDAFIMIAVNNKDAACSIRHDLQSMGICADRVWDMSSFISENFRPDILFPQNNKFIYEKRYLEPFCDLAEQMCTGNVISAAERDNILNGILSEKDSSLFINQLVVVLGTKCSLRCKECNNLIPYFRPQFDFDAKEYWSRFKSVVLVCRKLYMSNEDKARFRKSVKEGFVNDEPTNDDWKSESGMKAVKGEIRNGGDGDRFDINTICHNDGLRLPGVSTSRCCRTF